MGVTRKKRGRDLTNKQKAFVDEYLVDLNAAHAAARAGYSKRTAAKIGANLLTLPHVAAAVQAALQAREQRTQITADRVLEELASIAFDRAGKVKDSDKIRANELLGKHLKLFTDKVEHSGSVESLVRVYLPDNGRG